jgi:NTE family protein
LELFQNIYYELVQEDGRTGVLLHVTERSWGPNYIQPGIALSGNQDGDSSYNIALAYTRTAINRLNGEWRSAVQVGQAPMIFTEIYQPLDVNSRFYINPRLIFERNNVNIFSSEGDRLAQYRVTSYGVDFAGGRELATWGDARVGIRRLSGSAEVQTGSMGLPDYDYDRGELYLRLSVDKLDNLDFPREGHGGFVEYSTSQEDLGADSSFDQLLLKLTFAKSWDRNTLIANGRFYSTIKDSAPIQNRFTLGGLFNLPGFKEDEMSGQQMGLLQTIYMRRVGNFNLMPSYIGATLESGNVWEDQSDIDFGNLILAGSLFFGIDTFFGPLYFGYGVAEHSHSSFYFNLGKIF